MSNSVHPPSDTNETPLEDQCISAQTVRRSLCPTSSRLASRGRAAQILESFGNAKTVRNDNSSRYGKWIEVIFGRAGQIKGAIIQTYLLEKTRVVSLDPGERSYHVFYQVLAAAKADPALADALLLRVAGGPDPKNFGYLLQSGTYTLTAVKDVDEFEKLRVALKAFGLVDDKELALWKVVAAIMHLGNVKFKAQTLRRSGSDLDGCKVVDAKPLDAAAQLLGVTHAALEKALVERSYTTGGETALIPRKPDEAEDARDALSKALYAGLFAYLRTCINTVLGRRGLGDEKDRRQIGVLDIFGFEILQTNSFEQLCINYCNEKLQSHFNEECFRIEQAEYKAEEVDVKEVPYQDNGPCLELLENKAGAGGKPGGIFPMIEEELTTPGGSNPKLLDKLAQVHGKHANFTRSARDGATVFKVKHYAGDVLYKVDGLIEKSRDLLHADLETCMLASSTALVPACMEARKELARSEPSANEGLGGARSQAGRTKLSQPGLGAQFARQLNALMAKLHATQPHFVKCIKPNTEKKGGMYVVDEVLTQLRYTGIFGLCELRKAGYSDRPTLREFYLRYRVLGRPWPKDAAGLVSQLKQSGVLKPGLFVLGKTKVMLKHNQHVELDEVLNTVRSAASSKIGRAFKAYTLRKFLKLVMTTRRTAKAALRARGPVAALDAAWALMDQLPDAGLMWPEKGLIKALKERLRQEEEARVALVSAISSRDVVALDAAIAIADNLALDSAEARTAKELRATLIAAARAREACKAAIAKPSKASLEAALAGAEAVGVADCAEAREVRTMLGRMVAEEAATAAYTQAHAANDVAGMDAALARFTELGLPLPKGARAARDALAQKQARERSEKEVKELLAKAVAEKDLLLVQERLQKALELGVSGREVDAARRLLKESQEAAEALAHSRAQADAVSSKLTSAVGVSAEDVQEMKVAIKRAESAAGSGPGEKEAIAEAKKVAAKAEAALKSQDKLRTALLTKDYDKILEAVNQAESQGLNIAELDESKKFLKTLEASPLPQAVATGTMVQILDISRGARWRFEKFGGLRPAERFAKGRMMLAATKKKIQDGMLVYTNEVIPRSLLDLDSVMGKQAVSCHKCLLGFCGDRKTTYPAAAGHHVLMTGVQSIELRDEIFAQLCKHLTGNPESRSTLRGWILLCLCVDLFPPSVKFELYLLNFLGSASQDKAYGEYARYSIARLEEALDLDEAALENLVLERGLPSVEFIWHVLSGQSNPYRYAAIVPHRCAAAAALRGSRAHARTAARGRTQDEAACCCAVTLIERAVIDCSSQKRSRQLWKEDRLVVMRLAREPSRRWRALAAARDFPKAAPCCVFVRRAVCLPRAVARTWTPQASLHVLLAAALVCPASARHAFGACWRARAAQALGGQEGSCSRRCAGASLFLSQPPLLTASAPQAYGVKRLYRCERFAPFKGICRGVYSCALIRISLPSHSFVRLLLSRRRCPSGADWS